MSFNRTYCNCNNISGPFYIIGDCHGCGRELAQLLGVLGFELDGEGFIWAPAHSEKAGECLTPRPTLADLHACVSLLLSVPSITGQILYPAAGQQLL